MDRPAGGLGLDRRDHRPGDDMGAKDQGAGSAGVLEEVTPADVVYA